MKLRSSLPYPAGALILVIALVFACNKVNTGGANANTSTVNSILKSSVNATTFYQATVRTGMDSIFDGPGPFTVFVPTDSAFVNAHISTSDIFAAPVSTLKDLVLYHTIAGSALLTGNFPGGVNSKIIMANGDSVFVSSGTGGFTVNGIAVDQSDIAVSNGVIQAITQYPLLPPAGNLLQLVQNDTSLTYLAAAITRASQGTTNLEPIIYSGGPYTLFAPNNNGFRAYGLATINDVNNADPNTLADLIKYHMVQGRLFTTQISGGQSNLTLQGSQITFTASGNQRQVKGLNSENNANVLKSNIMAHNGVLYTIDQVLVP